MKFFLLVFVVLHPFFALGESYDDSHYVVVFKCTPESQRIDFSKPHGIEIRNPETNNKRIILDSESSERGCDLVFSMNENGYSGLFIKHSRISYPFGYMSGISAHLRCETGRQFIRTPIYLASSAPEDLLRFCFKPSVASAGSL